LQWSSSAHDRLTGLVLEGADIDQIAEAVHDLVPGAVLVFDATGNRLATHPWKTDAGAWEGVSAQLRSAGRVRRLDMDERTTWIASATASGELLGSLVLVRSGDAAYDALNSLEERTLERAAAVCALRLLLDRSVAEGERRVAGEVVDDLVAGGERSVRAVPRARALGFDGTGPCVVLRVATGAGSGVRRTAQAFARARSGLAGWRLGQLVVVLPGTQDKPLAQELHATLSEKTTEALWVAASGPCDTIKGVPAGYVDAGNCLRAIQRLVRGGGWGTPASLGFVGVLLATDGADSLAAYATGVLDPLLEYDARRGTDLLATLETYVASGRSLRSAAAELNVHRNTVLQRLDRIGELIGEDWQQPEKLLELHVALRIHRLTGSKISGAAEVE
jgi:hypothetical protein